MFRVHQPRTPEKAFVSSTRCFLLPLVGVSRVFSPRVIASAMYYGGTPVI